MTQKHRPKSSSQKKALAVITRNDFFSFLWTGFFQQLFTIRTFCRTSTLICCNLRTAHNASFIKITWLISEPGWRNRSSDQDTGRMAKKFGSVWGRGRLSSPKRPNRL